MASRVSPRSASDATRFTSTTPHAASKAAAPSTPKPKQQQQTSPQAKTPAATKLSSTPKNPSGGNRLPGETPEERVRRLRAAHEAARKAQTSSVDRVLGGSRRFFDVAHKATVIGLVGFTAIAGLVSIYSVYDMVTYNKQRRADFIEAQRKMEEDSLAAARLAFINGTATDAQVSLVEEANAAARESGTRLPPLLSAPTVTTQAEKIFGTGQQRAETASPEAAAAAGGSSAPAAETQNKSSGWWPFSSSSAAKPTTEAIQDKAKAAFDQERENQRRGGALDQIGLQPVEEKKKGWW
ncbi:hypothetical protein CGCF415_v013002 [Colletotrichum fructicola]|uniref:Cytochrome oxidase c assembly domain-containing protein n=1 Tax=Colletotrichum fructicola (strain Nara gc5) TaxID=1213859 RepID=A0A7J6IJ21_COLFN|nr:uncharacterized protein CGMCC3_g12549 [Colletotrichum fructicola]KAF4476099.1 hypothetical protein CGGC5_v015260 [Colletotrichum fructicola Nara gc5]KAI8274629.1 hypothetical protein K4K60_009370 [Colletotrichum sp. SAR11_57]KAE9571295.1 hypothetical protein CGMCC3_g12549 [Colletotrichum fructicola]KAF4424398.1 hypothetical protein CFRS1_v013350 [Colletotrichum fructicola]KAF4888089.1 hypothetical protein CGCFRS4_v010086 [Colletotrichum fructicola]